MPKPKPITHIHNRIAVCREYAELWQNYFHFFDEQPADDAEISEEDEAEFQNIISILALNQYKFIELCGEYMKDPGEVIKILCLAYSLENIKEMQESTFNKLQLRWHTTFIDMNKALGKMIASMNKREAEEFAALEAAAAEAGQDSE